jgi:hypothetical protein
MLQNGTHYKMIRVSKQYVLQNGTRYKTVMLQNGTCYTTVRYKTVNVTERYVTKRYTLQNGTFSILCYEQNITPPQHGSVVFYWVCLTITWVRLGQGTRPTDPCSGGVLLGVPHRIMG